MTLFTVTYKVGDRYCLEAEVSNKPKPYRFYFRDVAELGFLLLSSDIDADSVVQIQQNANAAVFSGAIS